MTRTIRVAIVDDQALVRAGLRMLIGAEDDMEVVGEAGDGREGVELVDASRPDVVLMDIRMPVLDGVAATSRIGELPGITTHVLILTTFDTDDAVLEAMRAGASGFLLKDSEPDDLVRAIRAVAGGDAVVAPSAMRRLLDALGPGLSRAEAAHDTNRPVRESASAAPAGGSPAGAAASRGQADKPDLRGLTERELEVLTLIGLGLTNAEIAQRLSVAESTAKTHVGRILMKLHARDRVQAVIIAYGAGLVH